MCVQSQISRYAQIFFGKIQFDLFGFGSGEPDFKWIFLLWSHKGFVCHSLKGFWSAKEATSLVCLFGRTVYVRHWIYSRLRIWPMLTAFRIVPWRESLVSIGCFPLVTWMSWQLDRLNSMSQSKSHFSKVFKSFLRVSKCWPDIRVRYIAVPSVIRRILIGHPVEGHLYRYGKGAQSLTSGRLQK